MRGLISSVIALFLAILFVGFAIANRQMVTIDLDPLPYQIDLPLYLVLYLALGLGLLLGGLYQSWQKWRLRREMARLNGDIARLRADQAKNIPPAA